MLAVATMPKKNRDEEKSGQSASGTPGDQKKDKTNVKVRPEFKRRLKIIAAAQVPEMDMGELVEQVMHTFMAREWLNLTGRKWDEV